MTTITAADAAARAGRTVDTIRHWCRMGAVRATKVAGRWAIDVASLDYRISLDTQEPTMPTLVCSHTTDPDNPCRDCQRKFRPIMFKRYVAALTEGLELPPLTGTPKQIAWAEQMRARSLAGNWEDVERGLTDEGRVLNVVWEAGWWAPEPDEEEFGIEYPNWQQKLIPHEELARLRTLAEARAWIARVVAERTDAAWWIDPYRYGY